MSPKQQHSVVGFHSKVFDSPLGIDSHHRGHAWGPSFNRVGHPKGLDQVSTYKRAVTPARFPSPISPSSFSPSSLIVAISAAMFSSKFFTFAFVLSSSLVVNGGVIPRDGGQVSSLVNLWPRTLIVHLGAASHSERNHHHHTDEDVVHYHFPYVDDTHYHIYHHIDDAYHHIYSYYHVPYVDDAHYHIYLNYDYFSYLYYSYHCSDDVDYPLPLIHAN
ncbi:hypothetical protein F5I97DRAFT_1278813 [Phlebopus sp. FC_14]|nr:hypothetical protein F5I97DRAFT_1278813 [Phlebopus sp. FC_14]